MALLFVISAWTWACIISAHINGLDLVVLHDWRSFIVVVNLLTNSLSCWAGVWTCTPNALDAPVASRYKGACRLVPTAGARFSKSNTRLDLTPVLSDCMRGYAYLLICSAVWSAICCCVRLHVLHAAFIALCLARRIATAGGILWAAFNLRRLHSTLIVKCVFNTFLVAERVAVGRTFIVLPAALLIPVFLVTRIIVFDNFTCMLLGRARTELPWFHTRVSKSCIPANLGGCGIVIRWTYGLLTVHISTLDRAQLHHGGKIEHIRVRVTRVRVPGLERCMHGPSIHIRHLRARQDVFQLRTQGFIVIGVVITQTARGVFPRALVPGRLIKRVRAS